jgi:DNA-binding XRE family transcriptional regulator
LKNREFKFEVNKNTYTCVRANYNFFLVIAAAMAKRTFEKHKLDLFIINRVKEMRIAAGFSQEDIAVWLNVTNGFIGQIESPDKRAKYNLYHLNELAKKFKCSPGDFLPEKPI